MNDRDLYRVFDQVKPSPAREAAILDRLLGEEKRETCAGKHRNIKKLTAVLAAAVLLLIACAFTLWTGLDQRFIEFLGAVPSDEGLLSPAAAWVNTSVTDSGATLFLKQLLVDRYAVMASIEFTVPEELVLDHDQYTFHPSCYCFVNGNGVRFSRNVRSSNWYTMEHGDPSDHKLDFIWWAGSSSDSITVHADTEAGSTGSLSDQSIQGFYFYARGFQPVTSSFEEQNSYLQNAASEEQQLLEGTWACYTPITIKDPGWLVNLDLPLLLGPEKAEIKEVYISPITLHVQIDGIRQDLFYSSKENSGQYLWDQITLNDRSGNHISFSDQDVVSTVDFLQEHGGFTFRLADIIDPSICAGGTLTICGQTFKLDGLAPADP